MVSGVNNRILFVHDTGPLVVIMYVDVSNMPRTPIILLYTYRFKDPHLSTSFWPLSFPMVFPTFSHVHRHLVSILSIVVHIHSKHCIVHTRYLGFSGLVVFQILVEYIRVLRIVNS
jgi:hypothetical protein